MRFQVIAGGSAGPRSDSVFGEGGLCTARGLAIPRLQSRSVNAEIWHGLSSRFCGFVLSRHQRRRRGKGYGHHHPHCAVRVYRSCARRGVPLSVFLVLVYCLPVLLPTAIRRPMQQTSFESSQIGTSSLLAVNASVVRRYCSDRIPDSRFCSFQDIVVRR